MDRCVPIAPMADFSSSIHPHRLRPRRKGKGRKRGLAGAARCLSLTPADHQVRRTAAAASIQHPSDRHPPASLALACLATRCRRANRRRPPAGNRPPPFCRRLSIFFQCVVLKNAHMFHVRISTPMRSPRTASTLRSGLLALALLRPRPPLG